MKLSSSVFFVKLPMGVCLGCALTACFWESPNVFFFVQLAVHFNGDTLDQPWAPLERHRHDMVAFHAETVHSHLMCELCGERDEVS